MTPKINFTEIMQNHKPKKLRRVGHKSAVNWLRIHGNLLEIQLTRRPLTKAKRIRKLNKRRRKNRVMIVKDFTRRLKSK